MPSLHPHPSVPFSSDLNLLKICERCPLSTAEKTWVREVKECTQVYTVVSGGLRILIGSSNHRLIPTHLWLGLLGLPKRSFPSPPFWCGHVPQAQHGCRVLSSWGAANRVHCTLQPASVSKHTSPGLTQDLCPPGWHSWWEGTLPVIG